MTTPSKRHLFGIAPIAWPILALCLVLSAPASPAATAASAGNGCTAKGCHDGIPDIVPPNLPMMKLIRRNGLRHKDMDGCVVCHGGNPEAARKEKAHKGVPKSLRRAPGPKDFCPNPGALHIARNTCGVCHPGYVYRVERSLMNTGAGIIRGSLSAWGIRPKEGVTWGNQDLDDTDGPIPSGTTPAYEIYVAALRRAFPDNFPEKIDRLPLPDLGEVETDPSNAAFIFGRTECQPCHVNVKGPQIQGNFRGTGCAACHMTYGSDKNKILSHRIAGNRKTGGIPVTTCQTCHHRGKGIGTSFAGLMESPSHGNQPPGSGPHGKDYMPIQEDLHHKKQSREGNPDGGLLCQDCHTSMDIHGNGNLTGTTLAQVEIECTDCHGTPDHFPWELPLGRGDEFGIRHSGPRGLSDTRLLSGQQFGYDYQGADGYLLSARGNPLGNVVRKGNRVLVHSASGKDFYVPVLKALSQEEETDRSTMAMKAIPAHLDRLECYTCHAVWTPQIYGCYVTMDFSLNLSLDVSVRAGKAVDWVQVSKDPVQAASLSPDRTLAVKTELSPAYSRWENPVLGINGEGRISPLIPGVQVVATIINAKGERVAEGYMAENPAEAKAAGQTRIPLAMDTAPAQPHTSTLKARSCESCHTLPKTLGLGIGGGIFAPPGTSPPDFSKLLNPDGIQLATVGSHWPSSRAFNKKEMDKILRTGTCTGCHGQERQPETPLSGIDAGTPEDHAVLMKEMQKRFMTRKE